MFLSSRILVNKESTSTLATYNLRSCLQVSSIKWNDSNIKKYLQTSKDFIVIFDFLTPLTESEITVKDSFHSDEICKQEPRLYMASLDVNYSYTNIPQDDFVKFHHEINILKRNLFKNSYPP